MSMIFNDIHDIFMAIFLMIFIVMDNGNGASWFLKNRWTGN